MRIPMLVIAASLTVSAQSPNSAVVSSPRIEAPEASSAVTPLPVETSGLGALPASIATDSVTGNGAAMHAGPVPVAGVAPDSTPQAAIPVPLVSTDSTRGTTSAQISGGDSVKPAVAPHKSALRRLPQVAVLAFSGEGIAAKDLNAVTSRFDSELMATDSFRMVERRNVDRILNEQGFQLSGACDNSECSVEIGQALSVDGIWTGELAKLGKTWSLSVKRTEVGTGQTTFSHVLDIQGSLEDVLRGACPEMALIASGRKKPEGSRTVLVAKKGSVWPWVVGGTVVAGGAVAAVILLTQDESSSSTAQTTKRTVDITFDTGK